MVLQYSVTLAPLPCCSLPPKESAAWSTNPSQSFHLLRIRCRPVVGEYATNCHFFVTDSNFSSSFSPSFLLAHQCLINREDNIKCKKCIPLQESYVFLLITASSDHKSARLRFSDCFRFGISLIIMGTYDELGRISNYPRDSSSPRDLLCFHALLCTCLTYLRSTSGISILDLCFVNIGGNNSMDNILYTEEVPHYRPRPSSFLRYAHSFPTETE